METRNETAIFVAIRSKDIAEIKRLLNTGADLTWRNADKLTPIGLAATLSQWECVEAIAEYKKTDIKDDATYGNALIFAAKSDSYKTVKILLEANAPSSWSTASDGNRALHWAVKNNNKPMIEVLLQHGADVTAQNTAKQTPIQLARSANQWECVETIAKNKKADDNDNGKYGDALVIAIKIDRLETTQILLEAGASKTWMITESGNRGLHCAVQNNNKRMIKLLLKHGFDTKLTVENTEKKYTPIQLAAHLGHWKCVKAIAKAVKADDKDNARYGDALLLAVKDNQLDVVEILIQANTPITWETTTTKNRCLHEAVIKKNPEMVALLLKYGANPSARNKAEQTPMELACSLGHWECASLFTQDASFKFDDSTKAGIAFIEATKASRFDIAAYLLKAGASTTEITKPDGNTILHWAVQTNNLKAIRYALKIGASQTTQNTHDNTPIELASELGHWDCVQLLLELGNPDSNQKTLIDSLHYENALLHAIKQGNYAIVKLLLEHHAPCLRWNSEMGHIALYHAITHSKKNPDIVTLLLNHGANPNIKNKDGKTTYDLAQQLGSQECVKQLQKYDHDKNNDASIEKKNVDLVENYCQKADDLYESVCENAIQAYKLPETLLRIRQYHRDILEYDLVKLKAQRDTLKNNTSIQTEYLTQSINLNSELGKLSVLIATIQSLLHYPQHPIQINNLQHIDVPEAQHILVYLERKQRIDRYTETLRAYLIDFKFHLTQAQWRVKNFFGNWVDGVPSHSKSMNHALENISNSTSADNIYKAYVEIFHSLRHIPKSTRRDDNTREFYKQSYQVIKSINFNVGPPAYHHSILQSTTASQLTFPITSEVLNQPQYTNQLTSLLPAPSTQFEIQAMDARNAKPGTPLYPTLTGYPYTMPTYTQSSLSRISATVPLAIQPESLSTNGVTTTSPLNHPPTYTNADAIRYSQRSINSTEKALLALDVEMENLPPAPTEAAMLRTSNRGLFSIPNKTPVQPIKSEKSNPTSERVAVMN